MKQPLDVVNRGVFVGVFEDENYNIHCGNETAEDRKNENAREFTTADDLPSLYFGSKAMLSEDCSTGTA